MPYTPDKKLIRILYRLFGWLLAGHVVLGLLLLGLPPVMLTWQNHPGTLPGPTNFSRVFDRSTIPMPGQGFSPNQTFSATVIDKSGQRIGKYKITGLATGWLQYYDENDNLLQQYAIDSLRRLQQTPLSQLTPIIRQRVLNDRRQQARQRDSIWRANPDARLWLLPDRWLLEPGQSAGYGFSMQLPVTSQIIYKPTSFLSPLHTKSHWLISQRPYAELRTRRYDDPPYQLYIVIHRWADLADGGGWLMAWGMLLLCLFLSTTGLVCCWLRQTFRDMLDDVYFAPAITTRFRRIGWVFVGMFVVRNGLDILNPIMAHDYVRSQGFEVNGWQYTGPDHWLWLFVGLVTLVLAQIFHYGSQLQREQDLTI